MKLEEAVSLADNLQHMMSPTWRWRTELVVSTPTYRYRLATYVYTSPSAALNDVARVREIFGSDSAIELLLSVTINVQE